MIIFNPESFRKSTSKETFTCYFITVLPHLSLVFGQADLCNGKPLF